MKRTRFPISLAAVLCAAGMAFVLPLSVRAQRLRTPQAGTDPGAGAAAAQPIELMAARASDGTVHLLWTVTRGWLPASGVNVYRSDKPGTPLNASPIKLDPRTLNADNATLINTATATTRVLFGNGVGSRAGKSLSSQTAFAAYESRIGQLRTQTTTHSGQIAAEAAKDPAVQAYRQRLRAANANPAAPSAAGSALTGDDKVVSVRIQVLMLSLTNYKAAQHLGLAFVDSTATANTAYTYTLKSADTTPATLATTAIAADTPAQPPAPAELDGVQTGQGVVALHWEPVDDATERQLASVSYSVYKNGTKLNTSPIRLAFQPTSDGKHVATMNSFLDTSAALGPQAYTVTLTDAFGRESPAATLSLTVGDLRVPGPVQHAVARTSVTNPGSLRLYWVVPDPNAGDIPATTSQGQPTNADTSAQFRLTRIDAASGGEPAAMLNAGGTPIAGAQMSNVYDNAVVANPPADLQDMTGSDLFALAPELEAYILTSHQGPRGQIPALNNDAVNLFRGLTVAQLLKFVDSTGTFHFYDTYGGQVAKALGKIRSSLDSTGTPDKDYSFLVTPCYTANPSRFGTSAQSNFASVPTKAVPATVTGLAGEFQPAAGKFGYTDTSTVGKAVMRTEGFAGATTRASHVALSSDQKLRLSKAAAAAAHPTLLKTSGTTPAATAGSAGGSTSPDSGRFANLPPDANATSGSAVVLAGKTTLTWQPVSFTSKVRYRVYRASATGLFPVVQTASLGAPPVPSLNTVSKVGALQRPTMKAITQRRLSLTMGYYPDYAAVPNQNYALLVETGGTSFVDEIPASQRMHYHYRIVAVSRWGVESPISDIADVAVPATLSPSLPTLLKTQVDEQIENGHVRLTIAANPPQDNVAKYLIFRKPVPLAFKNARREMAARQVAGRSPRYAPPLTPAQKAAVNVQAPRTATLADMKANNGALLKQLLSPADYVQIGEVAAQAASGGSSAPVTGAATATPLTYTDSASEARIQYAYEVVAVNSDGIASKSSAPLDATAVKVRSQPPQNLAGALDSSEATPAVSLIWQPPVSEIPAHYVLERTAASTSGTSTAQPSSLRGVDKNTAAPAYITLNGSLSASAASFTDTSIRPGRKYTYRLRAVDAEGVFSDGVQTDVTYPALPPAVFNDPAPASAPPPAATTTTSATAPASGTLGAALPASSSAVFGQAYYTSTAQTFAVRVDSAAWQASGYAIDAQNFYYCRPADKFLRLTLRVKNMAATPQPFDYQTITASGGSPNGGESSVTKNWKATDTGQLANRTVAPGAEFVIQGVVAVSGIGVPARLALTGCVYDLTNPANTVAPLPAPFGGTDIAPEQPVTDTTAFYPVAYTEAKFGSGGFSTANGASVYAVTLVVRNQSLQTLQIAPSSYTVQMIDKDGDTYDADKDDSTPSALAPGAQTTLRWTFVAPKTIHVKTFKAQEGDSRAYLFPLGANP